MADNQVTTQFTADASNAVAGAQQAVDATKAAAAEMQAAVSKPLQFQSQAQPGGIQSAIGRTTVAQKEAAAAAKKAADEQKKLQEQLDKSGKSSEKAAFSFGGLSKSMSAITGAAGKAGAALAAAFGIVKVLDLWINRTENIRKELDQLSESARTFGQSALFNAKSAGLEDTEKQIAALRKSAQDEIEKLTKSTADAQTSIVGRVKGLLGLGATTEELAKNAVQTTQQITSQVNAAAEQIEKDAAAKKAADREAAEKKANDDSLARAEKFREDAAAIAAGSIEDEAERLKALQRIEQEANAKRLDEAKTTEERDAIFALGEARFMQYQAALSKIQKDAEKERTEATKAAVAEQAAAYEELRSIIDSAYQAQQQFSQSLTSGLGADITRIADALSLYGGWKK